MRTARVRLRRVRRSWTSLAFSGLREEKEEERKRVRELERVCLRERGSEGESKRVCE